MPHFICPTCGTQFAESETPPASCLVCEDERQYLKPTGQQWTTHERLRLTNRNSIRFEEPGLIAIGVEPHFGIGQRAFFLRTPGFNLLWDCVPLLDEALVEMIKGLGGLDAIAISHPHYYATVVDWSRAFGGIPIYLHAADRQWVMRPGETMVFWDEEVKALTSGLSLLRCGGHFEGATVLHWSAGAGGKGVLLSGDVIQVVADRKSVSFMYSYPNLIPLGKPRIQKIVDTVEPLAFDRIYGAFWDGKIDRDAKTVVARSADRYLRAIER